MVDEATRFKTCGTITGQESEDLLRAMLDLSIYTFWASRQDGDGSASQLDGT